MFVTETNIFKTLVEVPGGQERIEGVFHERVILLKGQSPGELRCKASFCG